MLTDPVDAFWVQTALGYEGKPFRSVTQGSADLDTIPLPDSADKPEAANAGDVATLAALVKQSLGDKVSAVRASERLATSAVCLVAPEGGPDRRFEKLMSRSPNGLGTFAPVLELNPRHPLVKALAAKASAGARGRRHRSGRGPALRPGPHPRRRGPGRPGRLRGGPLQADGSPLRLKHGGRAEARLTRLRKPG